MLEGALATSVVDEASAAVAVGLGRSGGLFDGMLSASLALVSAAAASGEDVAVAGALEASIVVEATSAAVAVGGGGEAGGVIVSLTADGLASRGATDTVPEGEAVSAGSEASLAESDEAVALGIASDEVTSATSATPMYSSSWNIWVAASSAVELLSMSAADAAEAGVGVQSG